MPTSKTLLPSSASSSPVRLLEQLIARGIAPDPAPLLELARQRGHNPVSVAEMDLDDEPYVGQPAPDEQENAEGCIAWITTNCRLVSDAKGAGIIPFRLYAYQEDVIRAFFAHTQVILLKARQLGITELVAAYVIYRLRWPYRTAILLSRGEDAAGEMLAKARICWDHLPSDQQVPILDPRRTSTLLLKNGSRILPQPATPGAGRVYNTQFLVLDEWAHQLHQAQIFAGAAPTASAGNQIIGLSSANGASNEFARQWKLAVRGEGMHPIFLPWHVRPGRTQEWYHITTRTMEDWQRAQEFPATAEEAFVLSGRPRFSIPALQEIAATSCREPLETIGLGQRSDGRTAGQCLIWERPSRTKRYVCGADVAEGLLKGDYSAAVILDWYTGVEVAALHGHWEPEEFARHLNDLCRAYGGSEGAAYLGVERNNHGHAVLLALTSIYHYPTLYHHHEYDEMRRVDAARPGWLTSSKSKPLMIDALAVAIREKRPYRNSLFVGEAMSYVINDKGDTSASGAPDDPYAAHDDLVVAYAIAEMLRHTQPPIAETVNLEQVLGPLDPFGGTDDGQHSSFGVSMTAPELNIYGDDTGTSDFWGLRS